MHRKQEATGPSRFSRNDSELRSCTRAVASSHRQHACCLLQRRTSACACRIVEGGLRPICASKCKVGFNSVACCARHKHSKAVYLVCAIFQYNDYACSCARSTLVLGVTTWRDLKTADGPSVPSARRWMAFQITILSPRCHCKSISMIVLRPSADSHHRSPCPQRNGLLSTCRPARRGA